MRAPAVCDNCGTIFPSGFEIVDSRNITLSNCSSGPCPKCGGSGHIPDGVYNFIGNTIELLSGPYRTVSELQRLERILTQAREAGASVDEVGKKIQEEVSGLSSLKDLLPKSRTEFYSFISIIITVIGLILGQMKQEHSQKVEINQVINLICQEQSVLVQEPSERSKTIVKPQKKVGRNDPCPCGSGKKYKKCCLNKQ